MNKSPHHHSPSLGGGQGEVSFLSSFQNPKVKQFIALQQKSSERRKERLFVVEGLREIGHCLDAGYQPHTIFYCPEILGETPLPTFPGETNVYKVSPSVYAKMAYRESTEGILAEIHAKQITLDDLRLPPQPLIMVQFGGCLTECRCGSCRCGYRLRPSHRPIQPQPYP